MRCLIFGTTYVDTPDKFEMTRLWVKLHQRLNPNCDLMLVDSASPLMTPTVIEELDPAYVFQFDDNIGHLSRGGRDGWGRAFCKGLQHAMGMGYDYVAHIEGDSLLRIALKPTFNRMEELRHSVYSVPVIGTKRLEKNWVETGLMLFNVEWVRSSCLVDRYSWQDPKRYPNCPEKVIMDIVKPSLTVMPWEAERNDLGQIYEGTVNMYDWITHVDLTTARAFVRDVERQLVGVN
jgi:hypothetical protein